MLIFIGLILILCLVAIFSIKAFLGYRQITRDARADYAYQKSENMLDKPISENGFIRAYRRHYGPRGALYIAITLSAMIAITLPLLGILNWLYEYGWRLGGQDRVYEPGYLVWQFMLFGGLVAGWALTAFISAQKFYARATISFKDELIKESGA